MYLGLVQAYPNEVAAFYLKPNSKRFALTNNLWELTRSITYYPRKAKKQALSTRQATVLE